ncbi:MAG: CusA/CzcA family heavy metal efflux RND transporter [Pseudomonadota bacterium]
MVNRILEFSIKHRWVMIAFTLSIAALGIYNLGNLTIDAVPDITNVQVLVSAESKGYSPLEVEQRVTFPIETALAGIPGLQETRSNSHYGISQVTAIFKDGTDIYFARQQVSERIQEVKSDLPPGIEPKMGPIATGLGEIYMWTVEALPDARKPDGTPYTLTDLRTIQDWIIRPQLRNVQGVTEINVIGGYEKEFHVTPDPWKLIAHGLTFSDVIKSLSQNNANVGAGYIEKRGGQYLVRVPGQVRDLEGIGRIIVGNVQGIPIRVRDVAQVHLGKQLRTGAATKNGEETVLGTAFMLMGENSRIVAERVSQRLEQVNRTLPEGVSAKPVYSRTKLVDRTIRTVKSNLFEGAVLVVVILFLFLGNLRAAVITAFVIPLSMLFAASGMVVGKISANLMSLGAVDFGIIVDGAVVIVENCARRLSLEQRRTGKTLPLAERLDIVRDAAREVRKPMLFGELIIMIVYLPILTLTGVEGKTFLPMALTVLMALTGALVLSFTFVPAAVAIFLSGKTSHKENLPTRWAAAVYAPLLDFSLANRVVVIVASVCIVILSLFAAHRMGTEFIPSLDEGDIAVHTMAIPGTSLSLTIHTQSVMEKIIKQKFPQVETIFTRIGTSEISQEPHPPSVTENVIVLKPRDQWPDPKLSKRDLVRQMEREVAKIPGLVYEFSQPIRMRFNHLLSGVRSDVAVKVFGDDMDLMVEKSNQIADVLKKIPGASHVKVEPVTGLPVLTTRMDHAKMDRYGLNVSDVQEIAEIAIGGKNAGLIFEGDRRFDLVVRLPEDLRQDLDALKRLPIPLPDPGGVAGEPPASTQDLQAGERRNFVTLGSVADLVVELNPNQVTREDGKRRVVVTANVRGRDLGSFVEEAEEAIRKKVSIPPGYWTAWGGLFEQMISAANRLKIVVPVALLFIFVLLFAAFGSVKSALLVFTGVPLALTGGIAALWLSDIPLSISAGVGFIALSGVAVLNGLVLVTFINKLREEGKPVDEAIREGALTRLRPVLMTALVASFGFVPMAIATGTGAEVQRPLATVVIGGLISSTVLTLLVLPALYGIVHGEKQDNV